MSQRERLRPAGPPGVQFRPWCAPQRPASSWRPACSFAAATEP